MLKKNIVNFRQGINILNFFYYLYFSLKCAHGVLQLMCERLQTSALATCKLYKYLATVLGMEGQTVKDKTAEGA